MICADLSLVVAMFVAVHTFVGGVPSNSAVHQNATPQLHALERLETEFQGVTRTALLFVPAELPDGLALPLVFNYHGFGSSGQGQAGYTNMDEVAARENFAVLYPDGVAPPGDTRSHNGGSCCPSANDIEDPTDDVLVIALVPVE